MWNLATAPAWSDLIRVTVLKNNGFLHSFCNFSKNNAFGENFIRTKFILCKIFFRMSIFSSRKTLRMFFNFCWKNCEKTFVGGCDYFEGKGLYGYKNQCKLFCKEWGFDYFSYNKFKKKKTIFFKITVKNNFWRARPFFREWDVGRQKWNDLFYGKLGSEYVFEIFSSENAIPAEWKLENQFWGTFSPISVVLLDRLFPKK